MSDGDGDEANQEAEPPEAPEADEEAEVESDEAALWHFGRYRESRLALPWEQWSFREKANFCMDRLFLGFLAIFLLLLFSEVCYKMWYVTNVRKIAAFLKDSSTGLFGWLFAQEEGEELFEL
ncbi:unnamed protein product [Lota lota]